LTWVQESIAPQISTNFEELGQLFANPLPNNEAWRSEVQERAEVLITAQDGAATMAPPVRFADSHKSLLEALDLYYAEGADLTLTWLAIAEAKNLDLAAYKFEEGSKLIALAALQVSDAAKGNSA